MKTSNFLLPFIFALNISFSLHGQSKSVTEISTNDDDGSLHLIIEDGEVTKLKIDGKTIDKSDYDSYQHIIDKYKNKDKDKDKSTPTPPNPPNHNEKDYDETKMESILTHKLATFLAEKEQLNFKKYKLKLTQSKVILNGKNLGKQVLSECLDIFEDTAGYALSKGSTFKVKKTPNSKSISLTIED